MLKRRLIPVVIMRNGSIVQSRLFKRYQIVGRPRTVVQRLGDWASDELIFLDISRERLYDLGRDDLNAANWADPIDIIKDFARHCAIPLTYGGLIRTLDEAEAIILAGADKVSINTLSHQRPEMITELAKAFGSQATVVSVDVLRHEDGRREVMVCGREPTGRQPVEWAREATDRGAGEIFLNAVHKDGAGTGYDIELVEEVVDAVGIPVIACGGAGSWGHFSEVATKTAVSAIAAANIFHYTENSVYECKRHLCEHGHNFRKAGFRGWQQEEWM